MKQNATDPKITPAPIPEPLREDLPLEETLLGRDGRAYKIFHVFLAFPETIVEPGGNKSILISTRPQVPFKPSRLVIDQAKGVEDISVLDIRIGRNSWLLNPHGAPARLFPPLPHGLSEEDRKEFRELQKLTLSTVLIGQCLTLYVDNRGKKPFTFNALFWGTMIE